MRVHFRNLPLVVLFLYFSTSGIWGIYEFLIRQASTNVEPNVACTTGSPLCLDSPFVQFDRAIFFVTDGWPRVYASEAFSLLRDHSRGFSVGVPGLKLSHAIFSSYFTGQSDTAFWMRQMIAGDTVFDAMRRAGHRIVWLGKRLSLMDLLGPTREEALDATIYVEESSTDRVMHAGLLRSPATIDRVLSDVAARNQTLWAYSALYDTVMHKHGHESALAASLLSEMQAKLGYVKQFIDNHPQYLLILLTDHGVDGFGNLLHGNTMPGNDGFLLFYNPHLSPLPEQTIDVVDVAPTVCKFLRGVDIPANSVGKCRNGFSQPWKQKVLIENAWQLSQVALRAGKTPAVDVDALAGLDLADIESAVDTLKAQVWATSRVSTFSALINFAALLVGGYLLIYGENRSLWLALREIRYHPSISRAIWIVRRAAGMLGMSFLSVYPLWSLVFFFLRWMTLAFNTPPAAEAAAIVIGLALALVADPSIVQPIVANVLINAAVSLLRTHVLSSAVVLSLLNGIPAIALYAIMGVVAVRLLKADGKQTVALLTAMALVEFGVVSFFVGNFNPVALGVYIALFSGLVRGLVRDAQSDRGTESSAALFLALLAFFITYRSSLNRLCIAVFVWQMQRMVGPCVKRCKSDEISRQLASGMAVAQMFHVFGVAMGERFDINVDPFSGRVGMANFDVHPFLSASLMAFSKYWPFFVGSALLWPWTQSTRNRIETTQAVLLVLFASSHLAFYLMTWRYWLSWRVSELLIFGVFVGFSGAILTLLSLLSNWVLTRADGHAGKGFYDV